jgi:peroxiredoxin
VAVKAGEVTRVEYGGNGRPIIGRVNGQADWNNDDHLLVPKVPADRPHPRIEDFATTAAFEKARDAYAAGVSPQQPRGVVYQLRFETDGSFRIDDVPAGNYELRIRVTAPRKQGEGFDYFRQRPELASFVREVVMPGIPGGRSDQPLDLGTLELDWKQRPTAQPKPSVSFKARTLEGKSFDLTQSRGKHVLLTFWTTWSERCTEQLGEFQKLKSEYGPGARLEILGVSLDEDLEATRKAVKTRGYDWLQTWLEGESRAKVTAEFGVDILPATFLIDPEGHIIGRELEGERLHAAVRRALPKQ